MTVSDHITRKKFNFIKAGSLFSGISEEQLSFVCGILHEKTVEKGYFLMRQNDTADFLYIIVSGRALVFYETDKNESISVGTNGPGDCIGEMAYFTDHRRSVSVKALETCSLLQLDYGDIDRILKKVPEFSLNLTNIISKRLTSTHGQFNRILQKQRHFKDTVETLFKYLDLSEGFSLCNGVEGLLQRIVYMSSSVLNADRASLFLIDPLTGELWTKVAQKEESLKIRIPKGSGIAGWVAENNRIINIQDVQNDPRFNHDIDDKTGYITKSVLCGPVKNFQDQIVGVIQIINKKHGGFTKEDEKFFKAFSYQASIAVENYYLYKDVISNNEKISILLDFAVSLSESPDLKSIFNTLNTKIAQIIKAEKSTLFLFDFESKKLWDAPVHTIDEAIIQYPSSKGLTGHVSRTGKTLNIEDAYKDQLFDPEIDSIITSSIKNMLITPVFNQKRDIIGVVQVINKIKGKFGSKDENFLKSLSAQAGIALESSILHEEILLSFDSSIITLSSVVDARHPLTAGHSERVEMYSSLIAEEMGLSEYDREILKFSALLHDIGKIAMRDDILLKNGGFSKEERIEMEQHPLKTKSILDNFRFPKKLKDVPMVAACHHEKINGKGYPYGLTGHQIPFCSKILAVADVFDALTSIRDYPKYDGNLVLGVTAMPIYRTVSILNEEAGTHFDSKVVAAFMRCMPKVLLLFNKINPMVSQQIDKIE